MCGWMRSWPLLPPASQRSGDRCRQATTAPPPRAARGPGPPVPKAGATATCLAEARPPIGPRGWQAPPSVPNPRGPSDGRAPGSPGRTRSPAAASHQWLRRPQRVPGPGPWRWRSGSAGRVLGEGGQHHRLLSRPDPGIALGGRLGHLGDLPGGHPHRAVGHKRRRPGQQLVQHTPKRIHIRARVHLAAPGLLGRQVGGRSQQHPAAGQTVAGRHSGGDAEVGHLHQAIGPTSRLAGLTSRCTSPRACAAASASHTQRPISATCPGSSTPWRRRMSARVSPWTYSMTM